MVGEGFILRFHMCIIFGPTLDAFAMFIATLVIGNSCVDDTRAGLSVSNPTSCATGGVLAKLTK